VSLTQEDGCAVAKFQASDAGDARGMKRSRRARWRLAAPVLATVLVALGVSTASPASSEATDTIAPTSTATAERPPDQAGWYRSGQLSVTLDVTDDSSGLYTIEFTDNGFPLWSGAFLPPSGGHGPLTYTTTFNICCQDIHEVRYRATDQAGNVEPEHTLVLRLDEAPPHLSLNPGATGPGDYRQWTNGDWIVNLTCDDDTYNTGLESSGCAHDGQLKIDGTPADPDNRQTIDGEGRHIVTGEEHDVAGNGATVSKDLAIDRRPPSASMTTPHHAILLAGPQGIVLAGRASDPSLADGSAGSGVARAFFTAQNAATGSFAGSFEATRAAGDTWTANANLPTGTYTVQLVAADYATNTGFSAPVTLLVIKLGF
jgi:cytochrome c